MTSVLCGRVRLLTGSSGRQTLAALKVGHIRSFSAARSDEPYFVVSRGDSDSGPRTVWPDESMGPFGPQDRRFQLPGNVGFDCHLKGVADQTMKRPVHWTVPDVLTAATRNERHELILAQFVGEFQGKSGHSRKIQKAELYFDHLNVDCSIQSCPELLKKDFESYFPAAPASAITVVTVKHRCELIDKDVINKDREQLLHKFVSGAKEICLALWTAGFWADFIDPSSGSAFFGSNLSHTLSTTDEQWGHLGFHIEASGSCTVIRHVLRGNPTFVGTVFTTAPPNSHVIERLQGQSSAFEDGD